MTGSQILLSPDFFSRSIKVASLTVKTMCRNDRKTVEAVIGSFSVGGVQGTHIS
jgi:hypothetical protein